MKHKIFMPYVNDPDTTNLALSSLSDSIRDVIVIDNSRGESHNKLLIKPDQVIVPSVSLNTSQTYNFIRKYSILHNIDILFLIHNDCILQEDTPNVIASYLQAMSSDNEIGLLYPSTDETIPKDVFCAYRTECLQDIGEWDDLCFPYYFMDIDYIKRIEMSKWKVKCIETKLEHKGSNTISFDKHRNNINTYYLEVSRELFSIKWQNNTPTW